MATELGSGTTFALDRTITLPGSAPSISLSGGAEPAVLFGIEHTNVFPDGAVSLGALAFDARDDIAFTSGDAKVSFGASVNARVEAGIFTSAEAAIASLQLPQTTAVSLDLPSTADDRFFVLLSGYQASGHLDVTHPLGVLGRATLGVEAARSSVFAVIHRFDSSEGKAAKTVIAETVGSWRLPRHVDVDAAGVLNLAPGTWLVAETDGSLAIKMAAQLGYDISFARETAALGLTRDLGVKLDAALEATLGLSVSGRYLLIVGREDTRDLPGRRVRVRLHKLSKKGLSIGLNLDVGVTASLPLPADVNGLVQAVLGQHGLQVLKDVEQWADPKTPLADNVAKFATATAADLLRRVTGISPEAEFEKSRAVLFDALRRWDLLPEKVSAFLWNRVGAGAGANGMDRLQPFLEKVADPDTEIRARALAEGIARELFADSPIAGWLQAAASEGGVLALTLENAGRIAAQTLDILNGGTVGRLHDFIAERLDLDQIRRGDFSSVDAWLITRLADFLNRGILGNPELKELQTAITALDIKVRDIYARTIQAATKRYNATFAATYQRTPSGTALLDATFDMSTAAGLAAFKDAIDGRLDGLLTREIDGVSIGNAALSHGIDRKSSVGLHLPLHSLTATDINSAVASLSVEEHAGRVLVYDVKGKDRITKARYLSDLSLLANIRVEGGRARIEHSGTLAYETLQTQRATRLTELESRTGPFIRTYFPGVFGAGDAALRTFYADIDAAIGGASNRLGDVALSMQVAYPASILAEWLRTRNDDELRADAGAISRRLQRALRPLIANAYFLNQDKLTDSPETAALLVWSCLPVSTWVDVNGSTITAFDNDRDPFWDFQSASLRRSMAQHSLTIARLAVALDEAQKRLAEVGSSNASRFGHERVGHFVTMAVEAMGDQRLSSLLFTEAQMVGGARDALQAISRAAADLSTAPTRALNALADFAATLTDTFNSRLASIYGTAAIRTLGPMALAEASAALAPGLATADPSAMLRLYFFEDDHAFTLDRFMNNELPPKSDVRLTQTLAS